jgi:AcrR family transcriptional regulator
MTFFKACLRRLKPGMIVRTSIMSWLHVRTISVKKDVMIEKSDTKTRILDVAERLFAESEFDAVPIREIMRLANAGLGLMNYYFESKDALLEAVIARRVDVLSSARRDALQSFVGAERSSIALLMDAYIDPYLVLMTDRDQGWRHYGRLIAKLAQSNRWTALIHRYFDDTAELFLAELSRLYPAVDRAMIVRTFVFSVGAMLNVFAMSGRMRSLSTGLVKDEELAENVIALKKFIVSGLEGAFAAPSSLKRIDSLKSRAPRSRRH